MEVAGSIPARRKAVREDFVVLLAFDCPISGTAAMIISCAHVLRSDG